MTNKKMIDMKLALAELEVKATMADARRFKPHSAEALRDRVEEFLALIAEEKQRISNNPA